MAGGSVASRNGGGVGTVEEGGGRISCLVSLPAVIVSYEKAVEKWEYL